MSIIRANGSFKTLKPAKKKCKFRGYGSCLKWECVSSDNLGRKNVDKFKKLKLDFFMKCFRVDLLQFSENKCQNLLFRGPAGNSLSKPSVLEIF